jgi:hypothetical protein
MTAVAEGMALVAATCLGGGCASTLPPLVHKGASKTPKAHGMGLLWLLRWSRRGLNSLLFKGTLCLWLVAPNLTGEHWRGAHGQSRPVSKRSRYPHKV